MSEETTPLPKPSKARKTVAKKAAKAAKTPKQEIEIKSEVPREEFVAESSPDSPTPSSEPKRKNRRRRSKNKSKIENSETHPNEGSVPSLPAQQKLRPKLDSARVAKNAWKIYLAEISEEGVALIGDNDARELARRCFRLSELFIEEEDRRA
jgi:hypothetical protein